MKGIKISVLIIILALVSCEENRGNLRFLSSKVEIFNNINVNENKVNVNIVNNVSENSVSKKKNEVIDASDIRPSDASDDSSYSYSSDASDDSSYSYSSDASEDRSYSYSSDASEDRSYSYSSESSEDRSYSYSSESSEDSSYEASSDVSGTSSETSDDSSYSYSSESSEDSSYEASNETSEDSSYSYSSESSEDSSYEASSEISEDSSYEASSDASDNSSYETSSDASDNSSYEASSQASGDNSYEASSDVSDNNSYEASSDVSGDNSYIASEEDNKESSISSEADEDPRFSTWLNNLVYGSLIELKEASDFNLLLKVTKQYVINGGNIVNFSTSIKFEIKGEHKDSLYAAFSYIKDIHILTINSLSFYDSAGYEIFENLLAHIKVKQLIIQYGKLFRNEDGSNEDARLIKALGNTSGASLEKISFRETNVSSELFDEIAKIQSEFTSLNEITATSCKLESTHASSLAKVIEQNDTMEKLYLYGNNFSSESVGELLKAGLNNEKFIYLDVSINSSKYDLSAYSDLITEFKKKGVFKY